MEEMEGKKETPELPRKSPMTSISLPALSRNVERKQQNMRRASGFHKGKLKKRERNANPFAPKQKPKRRFIPTTELSALTYRAIRRLAADDKARTTFLLTYPAYGTALELAYEIQAIFDFYNAIGSATIQEQVATLLQQWVHSEYRKMTASRKLCARIVQLTRHVIPDTRLEHIRLSIEYEVSQGKKRSYPSVILHNVDLAARETNDAIVTMLPILQYPPAVLAEHLTMVDWRHFRLINNSEFFNHAWQRPDRKTTAPHLCALVERFDQVSFWGATRVMTAGSASKQAAVMESLLAIIEELLVIHNFNSALQLLSSLNQVSVQRLKGAWKKLSAAALEKFHYYDELFSPTHGHDMYRKALAAAQETGEPVFPVVSVLLGDMVHIEDGNPAHEAAGGNKINMQRLDILGEQLLLVRNFQKKTYRFETDNKLVFYLANLQGLTDEDLYQFSLKIQPTVAQIEEERERKEREKEEHPGLLNSPRKSIVEALSAISPRGWGGPSPRGRRDTHHSDNEAEESAAESDTGAKRRDLTAKKKFLPLFRNKSSQHIKEDTWIHDHEPERDHKDEDEEEEVQQTAHRPPLSPRRTLAKSAGWLSSKLPDSIAARNRPEWHGDNMEEAPPGYRKKSRFVIGSAGRRRQADHPRLRRTSSVDSLPKPPADWILGGGYSPRKPVRPADNGPEPDSHDAGEDTRPETKEKRGAFALFRNLSSVISRPADEWDLSDAEDLHTSRTERRKEDEKKARELRRLKKRNKRRKKKRKKAELVPSREGSSELSLSQRSRSSSGASEGEGKGKVEKLLRRAVSFVHGSGMTEEELIVQETGPEALFLSDGEPRRAESEKVPLSQWYQGDGISAEEPEQKPKKGLTRHGSLMRIRALLKRQ